MWCACSFGSWKSKYCTSLKCTYPFLPHCDRPLCIMLSCPYARLKFRCTNTGIPAVTDPPLEVLTWAASPQVNLQAAWSALYVCSTVLCKTSYRHVTTKYSGQCLDLRGWSIQSERCRLVRIHWLTMIGWDYVSELQSPTGLLFIPLVICGHGKPWWWLCRLGITPDSSTRDLWQSYQQKRLGHVGGMDEGVRILLISIWNISRDL
jgi:hypothetical protein